MTHYQGYAKGTLAEDIRAFKKAHGRDPKSITEIVTWMFKTKFKRLPDEVLVNGGSILCGPIEVRNGN